MKHSTIRMTARTALGIAKCTGAVETSVSLNNTWKVKVRIIGDRPNYYIADNNGYSYGGITKMSKFSSWARWFMSKGGA